MVIDLGCGSTAERLISVYDYYWGLVVFLNTVSVTSEVGFINK